MAYAVLSLALYLIITKTYKVGITIIPILSKWYGDFVKSGNVSKFRQLVSE